MREMSAVIFVGSLYVFITPGFSLCTTNESYTWLDSLDACNKNNMSLASQQNLHNSTLSPSKTEPYWIQELEITKMLPGDKTISPYNESFSVQINGDNLQHQCTMVEGTIGCTEAKSDSDNLISLANFHRFRSMLSRNITYRIGHVNYTSLLNENDTTRLIRCLLYSEGKIFSDECSRKRRAICIKGEFQKYAVSRLDGNIPRYIQEPPTTTGASTTIIDTTSYHPDNNITSFTPPSPNHRIIIDSETMATTLYIVIGASVSGVVVLGLVILSCTACLCRRQRFDVKQGHRNVKKKRKSDKMDMFENYSEVADSIARPELSQDNSAVQDKPDIVQYSTPEDAVKFAITKDTEECAIYTMVDPNKKIHMSKANIPNSFDANIYQQVNVVVDTNVYDTTNYQNEKVIILEPTYDHFTTESNART